MGERTITKHYFISGQVQGVGFRAFTQRLAQDLKLQGWVRNLEDGRVETIIRGLFSVVERFERQLRHGPPRGKIEHLEIVEDDELLLSASLSAQFEIRKDGRKP